MAPERVKPYWRTKRKLGGYSGEDPPLPIPNREVKLTGADGTATPCGRVGRRRLQTRPVSIRWQAFLFEAGGYVAYNNLPLKVFAVD